MKEIEEIRNDGNAFESQTKAILAYMREGNKITPLDALKMFGAMRLAAIIKVIEKRVGYAPHRDRIQVKNRCGKDVYVARYWL